jgi:hypothetical protein
MAQYHFHATILKRSDGRSVVASAAYRAGERLYDSRIGYAFDYRRRHGVLYTEILAPENTPDWMLDRFQLWNGVEKAEKRKDSQLARSIDISLMCELTFDQNVELLRDFVKKTWIDQGMLADIAIHAPGSDSDQRNIHAHILLTMRVIHSQGFGNKQRDWNDREEFVQWREAWADFANAALERGGFAERIDHRSLVEQGIDREPTIHIGPSGLEIEHRGQASDRAQKNRDIKAINDNIELLKQELAESEKRLAELRQQQTAERMEQIQKTVRAVDAFWTGAEQPESQAPPAEPQAKQPQVPAPRTLRRRPSAAERMEQIQKTVGAADAFWTAEEGQPPAQPLQPQAPPPYPENSTPPVLPGDKAALMPEDLSEAQKLAADQEAAKKQNQHDEQILQDKAAEQEQTRQKQAAADQEKILEEQKQRAEHQRVEELAKQHADRQVAQAEEMRQAQLRLDAQKEEQARFEAHRVALEKIASDERRREESERQARLEAQAREGSVRDAGARYAQALGQHYDFFNPYASLTKVAMAEYAAFRKDREALDQQIARSTDPHERQALDLRKRIEGADYIIMTSERIAQQSVVITGRRDSDEAVKFRNRADEYRIQTQNLRQQLRKLQRAPVSEKEATRERSEPQPRARRPRTRAPGEYETIKTADDAAKANPEEQKQQTQQQDKKKAAERQTQQEKERELQRKRDRER